MSDFLLTLVLRLKTSKIINDMAKVGFFPIGWLIGVENFGFVLRCGVFFIFLRTI